MYLFDSERREENDQRRWSLCLYSCNISARLFLVVRHFGADLEERCGRLGSGANIVFFPDTCDFGLPGGQKFFLPRRQKEVKNWSYGR